MQDRSSALNGQELSELKAHHLACSHLVKGCQDAIIRFREKTAHESSGQQAATADRALEILEDVLGSWCDTVSILHSALTQTSSTNAAHQPELDLIHGLVKNEFVSNRAASLDLRHR